MILCHRYPTTAFSWYYSSIIFLQQPATPKSNRSGRTTPFFQPESGVYVCIISVSFRIELVNAIGIWNAKAIFEADTGYLLRYLRRRDLLEPWSKKRRREGVEELTAILGFFTFDQKE